VRLAPTLTCLLACASCRDGVTPLTPSPVRASPAALELGPVALGFTARRSVTVTNPNPFTVDLTWAVEGPFMLGSAPQSLAGGSSADVSISFTASAEGPVSGLLRVGSAAVALMASGFDPHCRGAPCAASAWDPGAGACVTTLSPDGADCTGAYSCLGTASCLAGRCVGDARSCDDGNPCTVDVCGATGCGHVDGLPFCPEPLDPCQVPSCDPSRGCGAAAAPDGTACGARDCHTAQVCINGACVTRPVPSNQSCVDVVAGIPAGQGTADGLRDLARFEGVGPSTYDGAGNLYLLTYCVIRKITPAGRVTTLAGVPGVCGSADGFGSAALFDSPTGIAFDGVNLVVHEMCAIRRVTLAGLATTWAGTGSSCGQRHDGIGRQAVLANFLHSGPSLTLAPSGEIWFIEADPDFDADGGFWLREIDPDGEVFTRGELALGTGSPGEQVTFDSLAAAPDGRLFMSVWRNEPDAGSANGIVEVHQNGAVVPAPWPFFVSPLAAAPRGVLGGTAWAINLLFTDGGFAEVARSPSAGCADGPLADGGLFDWPVSLAPAPSGDVAFFDGPNNNVRLLRDGGVFTLAGPHPDRRIVDGPGAQARLEQPQSLVVAPSGIAYFSDWGCLRRLDTGGAVSTVVASDAGFEADGPFGDAVFWPGAIGMLPSGDIVFADPDGVRVAELIAARVTTLDANRSSIYSFAADPAGALAWLEQQNDMWQVVTQTPPGPPLAQPWVAPSWVAADPAGGFLIRTPDGLVHVEADGGQGATWPELSSFDAAAAFDALGNLYTVNVFDNGVRRRDSSGNVELVLQLADNPLALTAEPSGALLILVPSAILRFRP
jgi:hypothetical protein